MKQSLTGRQREVARILLTRVEPITVAVLAERFGVSARTIRYDLDALDNWFAEQQLALIKKPRFGVEVAGQEDVKQAALAQLADSGQDRYRYPLKPEERVRFIIFQLLQSPEKVVIDELASLLNVSRGTLLHDLEQAEAELEEHGVSLERIPGYGLRLETDEFHWRRAAAAFLIGERDPEHVRQLLKQAAGWDIYRGRLDPEMQSQLADWLPQDMLPDIERIVTAIEEKYSLSFTDRAFHGLIVHIGLTLLRLKQDKDIYMPEEELRVLKDHEEFAIAQELSNRLKEKFEVTIPESETGYLTLHVLGAKQVKIPNANKLEGDNEERITSYVCRMIDIVAQTLQIPLAQDEELQRGLYTHLKPTLSRLKYGLPIENPILKQVRLKYPQIYAATQKAAFWLGKETQLNIPPSEVGYLAMHFGAAVSRMKQESVRSKRILLVCASGLGTAKLLESTLRHELPGVEWVDTVAVNHVREAVHKTGVDLIISTMDLAGEQLDVPVMAVSPLPNTREINQLKERLYLASSQTHTGVHLPSVKSLLKVIERYADVYDRNGLSVALEKWLWRKANDLRQSGLDRRKESSTMLDQLLSIDNIRVQEPCQDWQAVVDRGAGILLEQGCIEYEYVSRIKDYLEEHGPYMVIAPGVVLLHARPEDGVNDVCMSLMTLKHPVAFGHAQNDPVDIVITFATLDSEMHVQALSQMMQLLSDEACLRKLREAKEATEVLRIIQPFVKQGGETL